MGDKLSIDYENPNAGQCGMKNALQSRPGLNLVED